MKIIELVAPFHSLPMDSPCVMAIGYFDGLHIGHQAVVGKALEIARQKGLPSAVMTFHPHPREVLGTAKFSQYLTPMQAKLNLLEQQGVEMTYLTKFDKNFSQITPEAFFEEVLTRLDVKSVVVGFDFTFGHMGKGTAETLKRLAEGRIDVHIVNPINIHGDKVSSTLIRERLLEGELDSASDLLGRPYSIQGTVVHGEGRGRTIGFPTANVEPIAEYLIPRQGVYAVRVTAEENQLEAFGVMNIGVKPTFHREGAPATIEVHLYDFNGDLYGQRLNIELISFLRTEKKFNSVDMLIQQIRTDVEEGKKMARQWIDHRNSR